MIKKAAPGIKFYLIKSG